MAYNLVNLPNILYDRPRNVRSSFSRLTKPIMFLVGYVGEGIFHR